MSVNKKTLKALILAYDFPPFISVGGLRPYSWYKYFSDFDVFPVVITRQFKNEYNNALDYVNEGSSNEVEIEESDKGIIIRTPYKPNRSNRLLLKYGPSRFVLIRKLITAWFEFFQWFFLVGPKKELYKAADVYLAENKVDVIIATGDPFVLFRYAKILGKKYDIPWIADYRDPWSQDFSKKSKFISFLYRGLEKKIVNSASCITSVSPYFVFLLKTLLPNKEFYTVLNGYDPDSLMQLNDCLPSKDKLRIGYAGTIYDWHPYDSFFNVFNLFISKNPDSFIEVNFYGTNKNEDIKSLIENKYPALLGHVNIYDRLPNNELLKQLSKNHVLLLFNYYSIIGTKIYDYLALKRKIILCYNNDADAATLKEKYFDAKEIQGLSNNAQEIVIMMTNAGIIVNDSRHLFEVLTELNEEFMKENNIRCMTDGFEQYSRRNQAEVFVNILKNYKKRYLG